MESAEEIELAVRCTVRGCVRALAAQPDGSWSCGAGHRFDRARAGYVNLLQPQDTRSRQPGDSPETVAARVRVAEARCEEALHEAVSAWVDHRGTATPPTLLEVGCGTGELLTRLVAEHELAAYGLDLSVRALREAARRTDRVRWFAANADRGLPFEDGGVDLALSVKAPKPFEELARVLRSGGSALIAVPGTDDLAELREATAGSRLPRDPAEAARREGAAAGLTLVASWRIRVRRCFEGALCRDLLAVGYRGVRRSEAARMDPGDPDRFVTLTTTLLEFLRP